VNIPLVSIIIPFYNRFVYLERSIQSVINQTYDNWEIILIDDCSMEKFNLNPDYGSKIMLLRNENNLGPGLSRQRGLELARGEYVCFLDSDDYWDPSFLMESVKCLELFPDSCATYTQSLMSDGILRRRNNIEDATDNIFFGVVSGLRPWATCSILWRKKYLSKWQSIRTNQDALFEMETALNNPRIIFIPKVLCVIDKGTGQNSSDLVGNVIGNINRTRVILDSVKLIKKYKFENKNLLKKQIWLSLLVQLKKMLKIYSFNLSVKLFVQIILKLHWSLYDSNNHNNQYNSYIS
jgi:glycosyltransferase involved in cell wall biosynthesis